MSSIAEALGALIALVGQNWLTAAAAAFVVMIFEGAKPSPVEGEDEPRASAFERVAMIASLITPFLLFLHAFGAFVRSQQERGASSEGNASLLLLGLAIAFVFVLAPGMLGWLIARVAPPLARIVRRGAPILALAVFAFTVYVTYENALFVLNFYLVARPQAALPA